MEKKIEEIFDDLHHELITEKQAKELVIKAITTPSSLPTDGEIDVYELAKNIKAEYIKQNKDWVSVAFYLKKLLRTNFSSEKWISVDTAPRDGTRILGYDPDTEQIYVVWWNSSMGDGCWNFDGNNHIPKITHYKLINPPKQEQQTTK